MIGDGWSCIRRCVERLRRKESRRSLWRVLTATVTATSADDGCGGWVVGVVVRRAEGVAEGVDGLALEAEAYVGVDAGGDADVGVAEEFLDDDEVDALFQEQGGGRVAEIVEADGPEPRRVEDAVEAAAEVAGVERPALRGGEDEPAARPARSGCLMLNHHAHLAVPPVDHQGAGIGRGGVPVGIRGHKS